MTKTAVQLPRVPVDFNDYPAFNPMWGGPADDGRELNEGDEVIAYEIDEDRLICAHARVTRVDRVREIVDLYVDGESFFFEELPTPPSAARV